MIVDDDLIVRESLSLTLRSRGLNVTAVESGEQGLHKLKKECPAVILLDITMGGIDGIQTLKQIKKMNCPSKIIMLTGRKDVKIVVEAMKSGAFDYLVKPFDSSELFLSLDRALDEWQQSATGECSTDSTDKRDNVQLVGNSPQTRRIHDLIKKINRYSDTTVLIEGETGTGKELIARQIYRTSQRVNMPYIAIDSSAIPRELLESELFGYEGGAFSGATSKGKKGKFESADGGTILLDEIDKLPLDSQAKLLRFLETRSFFPVGSTTKITVDVRIIASTATPLGTLVEERRFIPDLLFRLNVFKIVVPPLRERREDILPLARYFIQEFNRKFKRDIRKLPADTEKILLNYNWPGNIRELRNVIQRGVLFSDTNTIERDSLSFIFNDSTSLYDNTSPGENAPNKAPDVISLDMLTGYLVRKAYREFNGKISPASRLIGLTRARMATLVKKYLDENIEISDEERLILNDYDIADSLDSAQKKLILRSLDRTSWNISEAARQLKVTRAQLRWKMKALNLDSADNGQ